MDDLLSGADTEKEACTMLSDAQEIMGKAGMKLAKLGSNSDSVASLFNHTTSEVSYFALLQIVVQETSRTVLKCKSQ